MNFFKSMVKEAPLSPVDLTVKRVMSSFAENLFAADPVMSPDVKYVSELGVE